MAARKSPAEAESLAVIDERDLVITRDLDAPRALVFGAWSEPRHLLQWMGPRHYPAVAYDADFRVGGAWRGCLRSPAGEPDLWQGGIYREIVENERIVFTFTWDKAHPAQGHETLVTVTFADLPGGKTRMVLRQQFLPSIAERDGHRGGWSSAFDRLNEHLETLS